MKKTNKILANIIVASAIVMQGNLSNAQSGSSPANEAIRPFQMNIPKEKIDDLKRRVLATQWPGREIVNDATQGVQLETMKQLAQYWATDYDWSKCEAKLKAIPQFVTNIDGVDIHFIHVKSKHKNALPIIVTHGWPGSIIEQLKIIGPLTDPTAYGGKAEEAFDVVIPSIPGYGFSGIPTVTGWDAPRIAKAWVVLMKRLGYTRFVAQGGDWGALITDMMAVQAPPELIGINTNMAGAVPDNINQAAFTGAEPPAGLSADEQRAYGQLAFFYKHGLAYAQEMGNRPQTLYAIEDSPIGLAAWILDHDIRSYELITRVFAGQQEELTKDDILDNITLYWLTKTAVSSSRLYWENKLAFFAPKHVTIPVVVSAFPDEIYTAPKSWAEQAYPKLIYYNRHDKGGHFAAWEQPESLVKDLREGFKTLRK